MITSSEIISIESIRAHLCDGDYNISVYDTVDSTNTMLKEISSSNPEKTVIVASKQTAGRGRMGRDFISPDTGVYFSLLLKPKDIPATDAIMFTVIAAVAISRSIEDISGKQVGIKWVNDIFINNRKVCGILTEGSIDTDSNLFDYAIVGIGINVTEPETGFDSSIKETAGSVFSREEYVTDVRSRLIASTLNYFFYYYNNFNKREYIEEYRKRLFILGKRIFIVEDNGYTAATAVDIDDSCRLIVKTDDGKLRTLSFGEVSIRPI